MLKGTNVRTRSVAELQACSESAIITVKALSKFLPPWKKPISCQDVSE